MDWEVFMPGWIAIVEDESDIAELEAQSVKKEGFEAKLFESGDAFLNTVLKEKNKPALILLDIMLPGSSGLDILRIIRNTPEYEALRNIPVIFVTARDSEVDKILGLEMGSDDYIAKPFSPRELGARVKAVVRRSGNAPAEPDTAIRIQGLLIDEKKFVARVDGEAVELTTAEFKILVLLARRKGWVFDRNKVIDALWGGEKYVTDRTIDVHIKHLREKLGPYGDLIKTVRGIGYKLDESD